jgi:hypothetical protein
MGGIKAERGRKGKYGVCEEKKKKFKKKIRKEEKNEIKEATPHHTAAHNYYASKRQVMPRLRINY